MVKNLPANAQDTRDEGLIPGSGRSLGVGRGNPLQYSCLGDPMDRGTWWATVHWITNSPLDHKLLDTVHLGHLHARVRTHTHIHTHTHTHTHSEITNHLPPFSFPSLLSLPPSPWLGRSYVGLPAATEGPCTGAGTGPHPPGKWILQ